MSGTIASAFIIIIMIMYSSVKFIQLEQRANPNISSYIEEGVNVGKEQGVNFADINFRFAFTIEGFLDKETKIDSRYVKGLARLYGRKDGKRVETLLDFHECSIEELQKFPSPTSDSVGLMKRYKNSDHKLFCVDQERYREILAIWSNENNEDDYQRFEFNLVPCNYVHAEIEPTNDFVAKECIADRYVQMNYLGNLRVVLLTTEQVFK